MANMREVARKNLQKMVTSAAREVNSSRASAPTKRSLGKDAYEQLLNQIQKNGKTIQKVPIDQIQLEENIRETYDDNSIKALADSLQREGLIQFPTLCLRSNSQTDFAFICKNGHRRILAARILGWKQIECVILPFQSAKEELYHTIAANLREDVFYLDLAKAYQQASRLGESDHEIAVRVGVNARTIGWYRRLTAMSAECQTMVRRFPEIFNATWAVNLARKGELPDASTLIKIMNAMLPKDPESSHPAPVKENLANDLDPIKRKQAYDNLRSVFSGELGAEQAQQAWLIVEGLYQAGYLKPILLNRIRRHMLPGARKQSKRS